MRIAPGQNTKPKPMYIITNKNELFEYYNDAVRAGYMLLYHSDEIAIRVHVYKETRPAWASLLGHRNGIYLVHQYVEGDGLVVSPVGSDRQKSWGPIVEPRLFPDSSESPVLGQIPPKYKEALKKAINQLISKPVNGHEQLQRKLREAMQSL